MLEKVESFHTKLERELADAVLGVAIKANWQVAQELRGDGNVCLELYNWALKRSILGD